MVYVARNPKDVIVSFYYHHKLIKAHDYKGDLDTFAEYFINDEVDYSPFFPHILDAWQKRNHPNLHFVFYEDMKKVHPLNYYFFIFNLTSLHLKCRIYAVRL